MSTLPVLFDGNGCFGKPASGADGRILPALAASALTQYEADGLFRFLAGNIRRVLSLRRHR